MTIIAEFPNMVEKAHEKTNFYKHGTRVVEHVFGPYLHVLRLTKGETLENAVSRHEHYLAHFLNVHPNQKVLDVGCGNGGPTRGIARFLDVNIVGIDLEKNLVEHATKFTKLANLQHRCEFVQPSFLETGFDDATFDAAYAVEATGHAPDLPTVYAEIFRVLKPGAKFVLYEDVLTSKYRDDDPNHRQIIETYLKGLHAPPLRTMSDAVEAMKAVGFELEVAEDLNQRPGSLPWYYPIDGSYGIMASLWDKFAKNYYSFLLNSFTSRGMVYYVMRTLETMRLVQSGTGEEAVQTMQALDALRKAGALGLVTPMFLLVGRKPK